MNETDFGTLLAIAGLTAISVVTRGQMGGDQAPHAVGRHAAQGVAYRGQQQCGRNLVGMPEHHGEQHHFRAAGKQRGG